MVIRDKVQDAAGVQLGRTPAVNLLDIRGESVEEKIHGTHTQNSNSPR